MYMLLKALAVHWVQGVYGFWGWTQNMCQAENTRVCFRNNIERTAQVLQGQRLMLTQGSCIYPTLLYKM